MASVMVIESNGHCCYWLLSCSVSWPFLSFLSLIVLIIVVIVVVIVTFTVFTNHKSASHANHHQTCWCVVFCFAVFAHHLNVNNNSNNHYNTMRQQQTTITIQCFSEHCSTRCLFCRVLINGVLCIMSSRFDSEFCRAVINGYWLSVFDSCCLLYWLLTVVILVTVVGVAVVIIVGWLSYI